LLPENAAAPVAHLLPALHPELRLQLFGRRAVMERLVRIEPSAAANFSSWIVLSREAQLSQNRARKGLSPLLPACRDAISYHPNLSAKEVVVRFRGLACLRGHESGVYFGVRDLKTKWDPGKAKKLDQLFRRSAAAIRLGVRVWWKPVDAVATFIVQPGYNLHANRKVIPREFFGEDPPARSGGADRGLRASYIF
jgi:hypothetical protein